MKVVQSGHVYPPALLNGEAAISNLLLQKSQSWQSQVLSVTAFTKISASNQMGATLRRKHHIELTGGLIQTKVFALARLSVAFGL